MLVQMSRWEKHSWMAKTLKFSLGSLNQKMKYDDGFYLFIHCNKIKEFLDNFGRSASGPMDNCVASLTPEW